MIKDNPPESPRERALAPADSKIGNQVRRGPLPRRFGAFALAHLSDLHVTPVRIGTPRELLSKRLLGWVSWRRKRRWEHRSHVLEALIDDLHSLGVDHVGVTGDLTNTGLPSEIAAAADWLERLGAPGNVSVVPGNHDAYAGEGGPERWRAWAPYMTARVGGTDPVDSQAIRFPYVRRMDGVAIVGVSSARPTAPLLATGRVGPEQRERLEAVLEALAKDPVFRVVLIHHPPVPAGQSRRRQLDDAEAVRDVLARAGAELVLHGHTHRSHQDWIPGPERDIPVFGVPSSSDVGHRPERRARYHVYSIGSAPERPSGFRLDWYVRGFDPEGGCFLEEPKPDR